MSAESISEGVQKWISCKFAIAQINAMTGKDGTPHEGHNSDYSCTNPEITERVEVRVANGIDKYFDSTGNLILKAVEMYPEGDTHEPRVRANLYLGCGKCPFFQSKNS